MADKRRKRVEEFIAPFRVKPGSRVVLSNGFDPAFKAGVKKKKEGVALLREPSTRHVWRHRTPWGVLVVLQALDAAGKDGTIRRAMSGVNPQGVESLEAALPIDQRLGTSDWPRVWW